MSPLEEIKAKIDIVELIGSTVKLQRAGKTYKGLSPFKGERTPSFIVYPETGTFKDYSSGEQGDVFGWLMKKEGMTFREALRELANRAGVHLEERTEEYVRNEDFETRLRGALSEAAEYFHKLLVASPQAKECLSYVREKRKLSDATLAAWQMGYSLNDYQALGTHLATKGYKPDELIAAGLMIENEEGRRYDRFRNRLMIPIRDERGRMAGFGSRSLDGSEPKYMNSPQTAVFDKGRLLFGLDRARPHIRNGASGLTGSVIVEGYMDVIGVAQAGFANVVSSMGTALTESQFQMLKRAHPRIVLALDADAAGQRAVLRGLDVARETLDRNERMTFDPRGYIRSEGRLNADIRVVMLPDGLDPDELVLAAPERWRELIAGARPVVEHVIDAVLGEHDLGDPKAKSNAVQAIAPIIKDLSDPVQRDVYVQMLSRRLQLTPKAVAAAIGIAEGARRRDAASPIVAPLEAEKQVPQTRPTSNLELHFISLLAHNPELLYEANVALTRAKLLTLAADDFINPALQLAFNQLSRVAMGGQVIANSANEDWLAMIAELPVTETDEARIREEAMRTALRIREFNLKRDQEALPWLIAEAEKTKDDEGLQRYNRRAVETSRNWLSAQKALRLRSALLVS